MYTNVQNPTALDTVNLELTGAYRLFVPAARSVFAASPNKAIHLGHVRAPAETTNITKKKIDTSVYGLTVTALEITTKIEESGTFETASANDPLIRGLWAGSKAVTSSGNGASAFQVTHVYALNDLVHPTAANGHYYKVTTAGTSAANEPAWTTGAGDAIESGDVTFTEQGADTGSLSVIANTHGTTSGMLIDVYTSAITGANSEIFVAPAATLNGDGYGSGRDGANETTLKFAYTLLAPTGYVIPSTLGGNYSAVQVNGGYNILGVAPGTEEAVVAKIVAGFIGS